jgi:hypothetical protein
MFDHMNTSSISTTVMMNPSDVFCNSGPMHMGTVMGMGFGVAFGGEHARCLLFLLPSFLIDTPAKYAGAVFGAFVIGFLVEATRAVRALVKQRRPKQSLSRRLVDALLFGLQMFLAYCGMLLVMSYDLLWIGGLIFGLSAGLFLFDPTIHNAAADAELRTPLLGDNDKFVNINGTPNLRAAGNAVGCSNAAASPCCGDE